MAECLQECALAIYHQTMFANYADSESPEPSQDTSAIEMPLARQALRTTQRP